MSLQNTRNAGFTLIELLLAMTLFTTVLLVSTVGFVGMNRVFVRGVIRKQLSESVQIVSEDITRTIRASGTTSSTPCSANDASPSCTSGGNLVPWQRLCVGASRYIWQSSGGLYKDNNSCQDTVSIGNTRKLIDTKFVVQSLSVGPELAGSFKLYPVSGVLRTSDTSAFNLKSGTTDVYTGCKGSAQASSVSTCAYDSFNFVVNIRNVGQSGGAS